LIYLKKQFSFGIFSYFSGQTLYDPILDTLYNILFTAYPIGWFSTYDRGMNHGKLESDPKFYKIGMHNKRFNIYVFWRWYVYAAIAGFIIFWMNTSLLSWIINDQYKMLDLWTLGIAMYSCIVLVVNLRIMIETNTHNCFSVFLLIFSISSYLGVILSSYYLPSNQTIGQLEYIVNSKVYIMSIVLIVTACILFEYGWRSVKFFIEKILIKRIMKSKIRISKSKIQQIDISFDGNKDFEVKVNNSISISYLLNLDQEYARSRCSSDSENASVFNQNLDSKITIDQDQEALFNKSRRCKI